MDTLYNLLFVSETPHTCTWMCTETIVANCLLFLPGFCLSLLPFIMAAAQKIWPQSDAFKFFPGNSSLLRTRNILKSILLFFIPLPCLSSLMIFTHLNSTKCILCFFSCYICPLHGDLLWFIGLNDKRKKMYFDIVPLYFGNIFKLFLRGYIILQTGSPDKLHWTNWVSIVLITLALVWVPFQFYAFEDNGKEGVLSKVICKTLYPLLQKFRHHFKNVFLFCRKEDERQHVNPIKLGPLPGCDKTELSSSVVPMTRPLSPPLSEATSPPDSQESTNVEKYSLIALLFINSLFNIATMVLLIMIFLHNGIRWISLLPPVFLIVLMLLFVCIMDLEKIPLRYR